MVILNVPEGIYQRAGRFDRADIRQIVWPEDTRGSRCLLLSYSIVARIIVEKRQLNELV